MDEATRRQLHMLLDYVKQDHRICPLPGKWNDLWEMLPDRTCVGGGWEPPLPLILAARSPTPHIDILEQALPQNT